ncbi:hypothetical protein BGW80DRAFT_1451007 [Lactifluus volemus]|nr:hypothetical protein BGW80DRAFT_1451007 [Lactifluus volemus]
MSTFADTARACQYKLILGQIAQGPVSQRTAWSKEGGWGSSSFGVDSDDASMTLGLRSDAQAASSRICLRMGSRMSCNRVCPAKTEMIDKSCSTVPTDRGEEEESRERLMVRTKPCKQGHTSTVTRHLTHDGYITKLHLRGLFKTTILKELQYWKSAHFDDGCPAAQVFAFSISLRRWLA